MGSLSEELEHREAVVRVRVEELLGQIDELKQQLTAAEERLTRLQITRETVDEALAETGPAADADEAGEANEATAPGAGSVIGVQTVPPWRPGLDALSTSTPFTRLKSPPRAPQRRCWSSRPTARGSRCAPKPCGPPPRRPRPDRDCSAPALPPGRNPLATAWRPWPRSTTPNPHTGVPHDVIAPPGGRSGRRMLRPGPKASTKWLYGSVIDDAPDVIKRAFDQAEARDAGHHRPRVVLVDGARHQLDLMQTEAAVRGIPIDIVVDFVHVLEYIWQATWCFHNGDDPAAEAIEQQATTAQFGVPGHERLARTMRPARRHTADGINQSNGLAAMRGPDSSAITRRPWGRMPLTLCPSGPGSGLRRRAARSRPA